MQPMISLTSKYSRIISLVILLVSTPALAQPDTRRGFSLAREHCAQCHAVDNASESPLRPPQGFVHGLLRPKAAPTLKPVGLTVHDLKSLRLGDRLCSMAVGCLRLILGIKD